ncbi:hypothetical protein [Aeromonas salmonicida]|uniref:hypothetical protein n=1 Tax=Aeromonas salmonicida TaxID=645 RepID=UPI003D198DF0
MVNKKRVSGKYLDQLIESELLAMEREGLERAPIKASTLHARLKAKGLISGGLSTLSVPHRRDLIVKYATRQHNLSDLNQQEVDLVAGRRTGAAYIKKAARMENERDIWQKKYQDNIFAVLDLVKAIQVSTPIKIEEILSPFLIRELRTSPPPKKNRGY